MLKVVRKECRTESESHGGQVVRGWPTLENKILHQSQKMANYEKYQFLDFDGNSLHIHRTMRYGSARPLTGYCI